MTEVGAFDATGYRQRVLSRLRGATALDLSDPFFIVDLPVDVDDTDLIRARISALVGFWNKERSPNYKALSAELARHRGDLEAVLLDPAKRADCAAKVRTARAAADADRYGALDSLATKLVARYQGLPRSRLPTLARLARTRGLDDAAFEQWTARQHVIEDGADAQPLAAGVRTQIRGDLDEFGRLTGDASRSATLWTFLGIAPTTSADEIASRHAELSGENERRQHDHQMTVVANLLTYVKQHLMTGDPARYAASLIEDAKDRLRDTVAEKVIVDGELNAADFEACVRKVVGFGFGLSSEQARVAVRRVATDLGATLAVAPAVDYLLCPNCREPQPAGEQQSCRYCGADLYVQCPACGQQAEAAAVACRHCGASYRAIEAAVEQVAAARAELAQGKPAAARDHLAPAAAAAANAPALASQIASLAAEIDRVIAAAAAGWRAAEQDLSAHRLYAAVDRLARIARVAADVPGLSGEPAADRLTELAAAKASVQADIAAARKLPDDQKEAALAQILAVASDCAEAIDLQAALPLAPASALRAHAGADSIALSWQPSSSPGTVTYKVTRLTTASGGGRPDRRVLGTTSATAFDDAGAPGGALVAHEVSAVSGRRTSPPVTTEPVLMARDVTNLTAKADASGISLSWTLPVVAGNVVVEREVDPRSGLKLPLRRGRADGESWRDPNPTTGVDFNYHVYAEYRDGDGVLVRTPGATVRARVTPRPKPVPDLWASTAAGKTTIGWVRPASGEVRIYAGTGPLAQPGTDADLGDLARRGRYVGAGQRRVVDDHPGRGPVTYTSVTVDGGQAVAGPSLAHLPVAAPSDADVTDTGSELVLTFALPPGVTEAVVAGRRDRPPTGPDDSRAQFWNTTNTKLEIDGGLHVPAPPDGLGWYFSIHSVLRDGSAKHVAPAGLQLKARDSTPVTATYSVRRAGTFRRTVVVEVTASDRLPELVVRAKPNAVPASPDDGTEVGRMPGGSRTAR
ncbi:MAG TPA: zinc ribbon domain-containing protein, partial [Streptosporangiaceae bacterium]|nr:zinc ribbon domain-containing protein [Streptosporangiaceae bacterium]